MGAGHHVQGQLFAERDTARLNSVADLPENLRGFRDYGRAPIVTETRGVPTFVNEFWTSKQRAAHSLHEISYRACFKPQLPGFFIERLTDPGDVVHDPFLGRGTTALEAALRGRVPSGADVNPLSQVLLRPRLCPPTLDQVAARLGEIDLAAVEPAAADDDLLVFFHPETLRELLSLRAYLADRSAAGDPVDDWIRMVAVNRLTGHSPGFFSVYTLPPNQAVTADAQRKINARRDQSPPRRAVPELILRKTRSLLSRCASEDRRTLAGVQAQAHIETCSGAATAMLDDASVALVVTSPPFLDVVRYDQDNWLRCWFCGIDAESVPITHLRNADAWQAAMTEVFVELRRLLRVGGAIAFEVGEVRGGAVRLEEAVLAAGAGARLDPVCVMINDQQFTKTANCWGVDNNAKGTNTNRIVVFTRGR